MSLIRLQQCQKLTDATFNLCNNEPVQEILKCFFCQKFLSVAPIYNHGFESICGRCKFVNKSEDSKWIRQTLYENVAKFMIFPCSNVAYGCKAQLKWGEVEEHENTCLYKKLNCPFINDDIFDNEKCRWMGSGPGLNEHLENCHGDLIKKLPEINFSQSNQCILDCDSECIMNMFQHLNEKHHDKLVVVGEVHILNLQDDNEDHYVKYFEFAICFGNDIFRLGVFYKKDIRFVLQQLGVKQSSYCFELEIICSTDCSEKIVMGKGCVPLSWGEVWDQSYADYLDLPENVIDRFISEDNLVFFKVHLKKIV